MINLKAHNQALEEQIKNTMLQLHTSQLECQILKNDDEIEGADKIRQKLVRMKFFQMIDLCCLFRKNKS
jgi:hypothetical protein